MTRVQGEESGLVCRGNKLIQSRKGTCLRYFWGGATLSHLEGNITAAAKQELYCSHNHGDMRLIPCDRPFAVYLDGKPAAVRLPSKL
jgi:hypothetical protein